MVRTLTAALAAALAASTAHAQVPGVGSISDYYGPATAPPGSLGYRSGARSDPTCAITRTCYPPPPAAMAYAPLPPAAPPVVEVPPPSAAWLGIRRVHELRRPELRHLVCHRSC